jgi:hypothetical protein
MTLHRQPRRVQGYVDIGPITIPPLPKKPALTDRTDGNVYEIIKSGASPALSLITDLTGFEVFAAFGGPYVQDGATSRRLFSTGGGTLSSEAVTFKADLGRVLVTVAASPLDVWEVLWDGTALTLTEVL